METYLKPNAIVALNYLRARQGETISELKLAREIGDTKIGTIALLTDLGKLGLVRFVNGTWQITESGKLARVTGTV